VQHSTVNLFTFKSIKDYLTLATTIKDDNEQT